MKIKWTDLNLSYLKYFVDSINNKSLTRAALENHVSRPAISQAIRRLEEQLGYNLLNHKKKHISLTKEGQDFFLKSQEAIQLLTRSFEGSSDINGNFSLACSATLAEYIVLPFLNKLKIRNQPKIDIRIGPTTKVRQLVEDGESSLGLLIDDEQTIGFDSSVIKDGEFEFQSKSGKLEYPILTTEMRPEVVMGFRSISFNVPKLKIESWSICRKTAEAIGGTCLVPDLIPRKSFRKVAVKDFNYKYRVLAIAKNKNTLSPTERLLFTL
ncbi:MAG: hypothetical protein A4S09_10950 [Proteobacteria bacterium SG_bin7]|nr:MAG: hypothetical protein A4S09_10950 [Proteobacteria bacterium SG_bin7]